MRTVPGGFILPNFGGPSAAASRGTATEGGVAGATVAYSGPRKLAIICSKGNLDMAYPGLILGNAALAEGVEVHLFFTFWGLDMINQKLNGNLKFSMIGNTAMHMNQLGNYVRGAEHWSMPQIMGQLPGMTSFATRMLKGQMDEQQIPPVPEFLDLMQAAGAHMYACKLSFDMAKMIEADLHPGVEGVISAGDFIEISEGAQIIFV